MFRYKTKSFYNSFFKKVKDFKLVSPFEELEGRYKAVIEPKDSIHPVKIEVEIPKMFPHHKMLFWTDSLFGYPHLIYASELGKSWFCLNTPFAETAENQLSYELDRLRAWLKKMLHKGLPARIESFSLQQSLRFANIYSWEIFENDEYNSDSRLVFVGDFAKEKKNFSKEGVLYCKRIPLSETQSRFYAFEKKSEELEEIPYIIVEGACDNPESLESLSSFYGIDDDAWGKLLPRMHIDEKVYLDNFILTEKILENIQQVEKDLNEIYISEEHLFYIKEFIDIIKSSNTRIYSITDDDFDVEDGTYNGDEILHKFKNYYSKEWYFALGIRIGTNIKWHLFSTSRSQKFSKRIPYRLGGNTIIVNEYLDIKLTKYNASITDYNHYFGRGAMTPTLSNSKIAIIGVGAIGSILLESLVRAGATNVSIWDGDIVEPGNICRSIYNLEDIGKNKAEVCSEKMQKISPYCNIKAHSYNLYGKINYQSQETLYKQLASFDIVFDCTASNELLHFLSYTLTKNTIVSLCITNHAKDLLCISSIDGNPYEQRKALLAMIEQDSQNFYAEGTGCYSPTFLATNSAISYLVNMYIARLYEWYENQERARTLIFSNDRNKTITNFMHKYKLDGYDIVLCIPEETWKKLYLMDDSYEYAIGYLFGSYSKDGRQIFLSQVAHNDEAMDALEYVFESSEGVIDYIGEFHYSDVEKNTYKRDLYDSLMAKAQSKEVNTNNPLLALRNPEGDLSFFLFINNNLHKFIEE